MDAKTKTDLKARLDRVLRFTNGVMPIDVELADAEEVKFAKDYLKGKAKSKVVFPVLVSPKMAIGPAVRLPSTADEEPIDPGRIRRKGNQI